MATVPSIYRKIASHFKNKYAASTGYSNMSQGLSDALDVFCEIVGIAPNQLGLWQGSNNHHGPKTSADFHRLANVADLDFPTSSSTTSKWIKTLSYIGVAGWIRDSTRAHGSMSPRHFHCFALFMMNKDYVTGGVIDQQRDYLADGDGMIGNGRDYHAGLRPDLRAVHFMGKAPSARATVLKDTHSYKQPGKLAVHQDERRKKGYKITTAVAVVRVWKLDDAGNTIPGSSVDMLVTKGLRFYDLAKVKFA